MEETIEKINNAKSWFLEKIEKIEIISSVFSDCNAIGLEINYRKKNCKKHKHIEAKQYVTK